MYHTTYVGLLFGPRHSLSKFRADIGAMAREGFGSLQLEPLLPPGKNRNASLKCSQHYKITCFDRNRSITTNVSSRRPYTARIGSPKKHSNKSDETEHARTQKKENKTCIILYFFLYCYIFYHDVALPEPFKSSVPTTRFTSFGLCRIKFAGNVP